MKFSKTAYENLCDFLSFIFGLTLEETKTQRFSSGGIGGLKNPLRCAALHIVSYALQSVFQVDPGLQPANRRKQKRVSIRSIWPRIIGKRSFCSVFSSVFSFYTSFPFFEHKRQYNETHFWTITTDGCYVKELVVSVIR